MAFSTWNPSDKSAGITLSGGNLVATGPGTITNQGVRSTDFKSTGRWYCEITCTTDGGVNAGALALGISKAAYAIATGDLTADVNAWCYRKNGNAAHNSVNAAFGATWTTGDKISIVYDADAGTLAFWKNGVDQGYAYTGLSGSFAITTWDVDGTGTPSVFTANFGASAFTYTPPPGYDGWSSSAWSGTSVTLDPANKNAAVTLTGGNLIATKVGSGNGAASSTAPFKSTGKWYFEAKINQATSAGALVPGVGTSLFDNTLYPGGNNAAGQGVGWDAMGGSILQNGAGLGSAGTAAVNDVMGFAFDLDGHVLKTYKNGVLTQTVTIATQTVRPATMPGDQNNNQVTMNYGGSTFAFAPPTAHYAWLGPVPPPTINVAFTVPPITLNAFEYGPYVHTVSITVPPITLVSTETSGTTETVVLVLPPITLSSTLAAGAVMNAALVLPPITLNAFEYGPFVHTVNITLPPITLVAAEVNSDMLIAVANIPAIKMAAFVLNGNAIDVALLLPAIQASITENNPLIIGGALVLPAPRLTAQGYSGGIMSAALSIAPITLAAAGYPVGTITVALTLPAPRLSSFMSAATLAAYRTWVLNTRKHALSEYGPEFAFNSFTIFNGQVLAAGPNGLVVLGTQGLDNAAPITARARTGQEGFGSSYHKRIPRLYVSGTFLGDVLFRTITAEGATRTYSLNYNNGVLLQQRRIPIGKGPRSRFWQFEIENVAGADFSINDILVYPTTLIRRIE